MGTRMTVCGGEMVKFGRHSVEYINNMKRIQKMGNWSEASLVTSVMYSIFARSGPLQSSYNISQHDINLYAQAARSIPDIVRKRLWEQTIEVTSYGTLNAAERRFWKCMSEKL